MNDMQRLVDLTLLRRNSRGDENFVTKMIELFVQFTPEEISKLEESIKASDFSTIESIAHKLKPSIDQFAIEEMRETARTLEKKEGLADSEYLRIAQEFCSNLKVLISQVQQRQ